jgi:hypothetical protein
MAEAKPGMSHPETDSFNEGLYLTEVDHLNRFRRSDGCHAISTLEGVYKNLVPGVKEAAMPFAVSTTYQEYSQGTYWWLDQSAEDVAKSGYRFHRHPAALNRVAVEIEEAQDLVENLQPGMIKVFLSPRMTANDAPYAVAKREHLGDDDMLRIHMIDVDENNQVRGKFMQSIMVREVPLRAWVRMLRDPNNIFGKTINIDDETSAVSVMKAHRQLELPEACLPEGVISLVEAVLPYVPADKQRRIYEQLQLFRSNQTEMHRQAENIADRWLDFEVALADSLHGGFANEYVQQFITDLAFQWDEVFVSEIMAHTQTDGSIRMTRPLAAKLEASRRNILWVAGGVLTKNERIVSQLSTQVVQQIFVNELFIQTMMSEGQRAEEIHQVELQNNQVIAEQNVKAGGGCPGEHQGAFRTNPESPQATNEAAHKKCPEIKNGQSVRCPGCKKQVKAIVPDPEKIYCNNPTCKLAAPHLKGRLKDEKFEQPKAEVSHEGTEPQEEAVSVAESEQENIQDVQQKGKLMVAGAL